MPKEVVVLETISTVDWFIRAVEKIPGMEWLGEIEEEDIPPADDFFALGGVEELQADRMLRSPPCMIFTNQESLR